MSWTWILLTMLLTSWLTGLLAARIEVWKLGYCTFDPASVAKRARVCLMSCGVASYLMVSLMASLGTGFALCLAVSAGCLVYGLIYSVAC